MVPNDDGVNSGEWAIRSTETLDVPTYVTGRSQTSSGGYAPVYSASGRTWPYAWNIGSQDIVGFRFKLNQFGALSKHPRLSFAAKRSGILTGYTNRYHVGIFNVPNLVGTCLWGPVPYLWASDSCFVGTPLNQQLNYAGGWNEILLSITGDGFGGTIDLLDVNYVYLSIEP